MGWLKAREDLVGKCWKRATTIVKDREAEEAIFY
jgi:hypothetical protein